MVDILLPVNIDRSKWSVVACDQYTSQPEYWREVDRFVGGSPSTLRITLPEAYLQKDDVDSRIEDINRTMKEYLANTLSGVRNRYIYVERTLRSGAVRRGLMGAIDLECYDYRFGSQSLVRATEGTVLERIPPRVRVRRNAVLEVPHVMVLIDDDKKTVIEPLQRRKDEWEKCYDFDLMQQSGSIRGYLVGDDAAAEVENALCALADPERFAEKYTVDDKGVLLFAVGDGNHSLATAKECYEQLKSRIGDAAKHHPARYALVEVVNVHDEALEFEPIHRVLFDVDAGHLLQELSEYYSISYGPCDGQTFTVITKDREETITVRNPSSHLPVGTLQLFLDDYTGRHGGKVDYIHGEEAVRFLSAKKGNVGFLLPKMPKSDLFRTVILDGALPRKTFSMGNAYDKRFYLECRKLTQDR